MKHLSHTLRKISFEVAPGSTIQEAAKEYADGIRRVDKKNTYDNIEVDSSRMVAFKQGAEWHARQPLWISVEERLPNPLEEVILYDNKSIQHYAVG